MLLLETVRTDFFKRVKQRFKVKLTISLYLHDKKIRCLDIGVFSTESENTYYM